MSKNKKLDDTQELDSKELNEKLVSQRRISKKQPPSNKTNYSATTKIKSKPKTYSREVHNKKRYIPNENGSYQSNDVKRKEHAKRRRLFRRIRRIAALILICLVLIGSVVALIISQIKIKDISVVYTNISVSEKDKTKQIKKKYTDEQIIKSGGIAKGKNFVLCKTDDIEERIVKNLPYISEVTADKKGIGKIVISVTQSTPTFAFEYGSSYLICDYTCKVIETVSDKKIASKYTIVKGAKISSANQNEKIEFSPQSESEADNQKYIDDVNSVLKAVKACGIKKLTEINLNNMKDIRMVYDGRIKVHVGSLENIDRKMKLGAKTLLAEDGNSKIQTGELNLTIDKKAYFLPD